jgi:hypothetical protein
METVAGRLDLRLAPQDLVLLLMTCLQRVPLEVGAMSRRS